ncbi:MAG: serine/threonine protein kinase [Deltaproteobacteria bacterium]|nr:serine/threonine protein kinase [Deltaproteobacteria bacterium]
MAFQPQAFGKYYLVDKISTGGMAEVFKAKTYSHGGFENLLVIKRILPHLGEDQEFVDMFIDEAKVSVALQHANIVHLYDFGRIGDDWFMAMECLDGKDVRSILRQLARKRRFLPIEYAIYVASEACKGLEFAHRKTDLQGRPYGIVHRDVSPSNLLVAYEGDVKVADFGIAKAQFSSLDTVGGVLKGKYEYMSPEQASGRSMDARSDLFSLGIILHEMLTGRRLFKTGSEFTTLERIKTCEVAPPSYVNARVPEALDRIVMKALARLPEDRYQSAGEMGQALQDYLFPQTADQLRADLARSMQDLFADEIGEERRRLEHGSEVAAKLREQAPEYAEGWEGQTSSSLSRASEFAQSWGPLILGGVALLLIPVLGLAVGGLLWVAKRDAPVEEVAPTAGALDILVLPATNVRVDGIDYGETGTLALEDMAPGPHVIRLEKEGYETVLETVTIEAGQRHTLRKTMQYVEPEPEPEPEPAPVQRIPSRPIPVAPPTPTPAPVAAETGTLAVALIGGGWAWVYVDGVRIEKTAPLAGHELPSGTYTIRVENPDLGISHSEKITVDPGEQATVRARPL